MPKLETVQGPTVNNADVINTRILGGVISAAMRLYYVAYAGERERERERERVHARVHARTSAPPWGETAGLRKLEGA